MWLAALAVALAPLVLAFGCWERPGRTRRPVPPAAAPSASAGAEAGAGAEAEAEALPAAILGALPAAILGLTYAVVGLFGFVTGGFAPLPDRTGSALLLLRVDPLQSAICLALGGYLLDAARSGAASTPVPWRRAAVACALLLSPAIPGVAGTPAQLVATAPTNWVLHGAALAVAAGSALSASRRAPTAAVKPVPWSEPRRARPVACSSRGSG